MASVEQTESPIRQILLRVPELFYTRFCDPSIAIPSVTFIAISLFVTSEALPDSNFLVMADHELSLAYC